MSKRTGRTIRIFSLEVSPNLVLLNIRKVDFHDFWNYWKVTSSQNGLKTFLLSPSAETNLTKAAIFTKHTGFVTSHKISFLLKFHRFYLGNRDSSFKENRVSEDGDTKEGFETIL